MRPLLHLMNTPDLKPEADQWKLSPQDTKPQLAAGIPIALQFAITASGTMIIQSAINLFGSEAVAAYTAAWVAAAVFTGVSYLYVMRQIEKEFQPT